jgi:hypothetical protein
MDLSQAILAATLSVTKKWAKQRKAEERDAARRMRRMQALSRNGPKMTFKRAAEEVLEEVYLKASSNGRYPAFGRQIMYKARPKIQELVGKLMTPPYFLGTLLPDFMADHPVLTANWDVVFDPRGNFTEPHTQHAVPLGTIDVRNYLSGLRRLPILKEQVKPKAIVSIGLDYPKCYTPSGPGRLYGNVLFIEKEGFMEVFEKLKLPERYDIAIISPKGLTNTAARTLIDEVCGKHKLRLFVLHDFDLYGFRIYGTLKRDTKRYHWQHPAKVIDLGLRLEDVQKYDLMSESCECNNSLANRRGLERNGATPEEIDFLCSGQRVELNAFNTEDLIEWIESKLEEHGVKKIVPDNETLDLAYRRAQHLADFEEQVKEAREQLEKEWEAKVAEYSNENRELKVPKSLSEKVEKLLEANRELFWEDAVLFLAQEQTGQDEQETRSDGLELKP